MDQSSSGLELLNPETSSNLAAKAGYSVVPCILYVAARFQMARVCLYRGSMVDRVGVVITWRWRYAPNFIELALTRRSIRRFDLGYQLLDTQLHIHMSTSFHSITTYHTAS
jgi:hypothetical protein